MRGGCKVHRVSGKSPSGIWEKSIGHLGNVHRVFWGGPGGILEKSRDQGAKLDGLSKRPDGLSFHGGAGVDSHITAVLIMSWILIILS